MKQSDMLLLGAAALALYLFMKPTTVAPSPYLTTGGIVPSGTLPLSSSPTSILGNILKSLGGSTAKATTTNTGTGTSTTADQSGTGTFVYDESGGAYQNGVYVTPYDPSGATGGTSSDTGDSSYYPGGGDDTSSTVDYSDQSYTQ